jgi:Spy/CpxP family protein refolding chaperone
MKLRTLATCTLFAAFALALALPAAAAPLPGCKDPRAVARYLGLSAAQVAQVKDLRTDLRDAVEPLRKQIAPLRDEIGDLLATPAPDACTVGGLVVKVNGLTDQIDTLHDKFEKDFELILTPEQLVKWKALQVVCRAQGQPTGA